MSSSISQSSLLFQVRWYGGNDPMDLDSIQKRVLLVLNLYDKIDNEKVKVTTFP